MHADHSKCVRLHPGQMLGDSTDDWPGLLNGSIHLSRTVEGDKRVNIQVKPTCDLGQRLHAAVQERIARVSCVMLALRTRRDRMWDVGERISWLTPVQTRASDTHIRTRILEGGPRTPLERRRRSESGLT